MPTRYGKAILGIRDNRPDGVCSKDSAGADSQLLGDCLLVKVDRLLPPSPSMALGPTVPSEAVPERIAQLPQSSGPDTSIGSLRTSEMKPELN